MPEISKPYFGCAVFYNGIRCGGSMNDQEVFDVCSKCPGFFPNRMDRGDHTSGPVPDPAVDFGDPSRLIELRRGERLEPIEYMDMPEYPEERVVCEYCSNVGIGGHKCGGCGAQIPLGLAQTKWQEAFLARTAGPKWVITSLGRGWKGVDFG